MSASISGRQQEQEAVAEDNINDLEPTVALQKLFLSSLDNVAQAKTHFPSHIASRLDGIPRKLEDAYFRLQIWWHDMDAESDQKLTFEKILSFENCIPSGRVYEILQKFQDEFGMIEDLLVNLVTVSEIHDDLLAPLRDACNRVMALVLDLVDLSDFIETEQALRLHDGPKRDFIDHIIATESRFLQSHSQKGKGTQSKVSDDTIAKDTSSSLHEHQSTLSASHEVQPWAPRYVLTIDGEGVSGLSSLIVLETLMGMLKNLEAANDPSTITNSLNVCHYFDYVVGTGTGGIIAIMLSRLRMSITECIVAYKRWAWETQGRGFASSLASKYDGLLLQQEPAMCRTMLLVHQMPHSPTFLNSFQGCEQQPIDIELSQAARATTAAPEYFKPVSISGQYYTDGSLSRENLEMLAFEEVRRLSQREAEGHGHVAMLLSLCTESNGRRSKSQRWLDIMPSWLKDPRRTEFSKYVTMVDNRLDYARFNVPLGKLDSFEPKGMGDVEVAARKVLKKSDVRSRMLQCAETLFTARKNRAQTDRWKLYYGISKAPEARTLNVSGEAQSAGAREKKSRITSSRNQNPPLVIRDPDLTVSLLPRTISVQVYHRVDERGISEETSLLNFDWTVPENYKDLLPGEIKSEAWAGEESASKKLYMRAVSCRVKGPPFVPNGKYYAILDNIFIDAEVLSKNAIVQICGFIHQHPNALFSLEVYCDIGLMKLQKSEWQSYAEMVRMELKRKVKINFLGLEYIPHCDVDVLLNLKVVKGIVKEDTTLELDQAAYRAFVTKVLNKAPKLFAICVYLHLDIDYLRHLINTHGCSDDPSEHPDYNTSVGCQDEDCSTNTHDVIRCLPKFFARRVIRNSEHHNLSDDDVLPLYHTGDKAGSGRPRISRLGAKDDYSGLVYKVKIERSYQHVAGDPDCEFDVMEFSRRELLEPKAMLPNFNDFPHDHIVGHIMSWTQRRIAYVLYDKAQCNLREFIQNTPSPSLTKPVVLWFLGQLKGLATAIEHMQRLMGNWSIDAKNPYNNTNPENILAFDMDEGQRPIFKIRNFGQTKGRNAPFWVEKDRSRRAYLAPPEIYGIGPATSSGIDTWAIGCIFLELLLWLSGFYLDGEEAWFPGGPSDFPGYNPDDVFWYQRPGGSYESAYSLKPVVERALHELDRLFVEMRAFQSVIEAIRRLLRIDPDTRWDAARLADWMEQIIRQVEADFMDFTNTPDYYQRQYRKNRAESNLGKTPWSEWLIDPEGPLPASSTPSASRRNQLATLQDTLLQTDFGSASFDLGGILSEPLNTNQGPSTPSVSLTDYDADEHHEW